MQSKELSQLELLSAIDDLRQRVNDWTEQQLQWEPARRCQSLLKRVLDRVETLSIRLESPLVVATFGGTGTGKSSLVNALVGEECTASGRQRPTTKKPILITHTQTELDALGLPLSELNIVQRDTPILKDIIVLDCPDPDTNEEESADSNLQRLRRLLPYCDVLIYVSTQQKYRSARVNEELKSAAAGCRMLFVQTHADLDEDIRDDWKLSLGDEFEVPEMYFVDSARGLQEQQSGQEPSGDLGRLITLLTTQLGASSRVQIRRANVVDLVQAGLTRCCEILDQHGAQLDDLGNALADQRQQLGRKMATGLQADLLESRNLWERRLLSAVTDRWGVSPFSSVLRFYNGIGAIVTSMTFLRARSTAQMAILGTIQGARWFDSKRQEQNAESTLDRVSHFGIDDGILREAEIVVEGHATNAGFRLNRDDGDHLESLRRQAAVVESQFVGNAGHKIEGIITDLAEKNSRFGTKITYELLFIVYVLFVLYRVGKNFFYESFIQGEDLYTTDFYIAAGLFFALWSGVLVISLTRSLRNGLTAKIQAMAQQLVESKLSIGLFPALDESSRRARHASDEAKRLLTSTTELRHQIAVGSNLGGQKVTISEEPASL